MNFQYISPIESSKVYLDLAFKKAREKGKSKKLTGNWLQIIRQKEAMKLDIVKDDLLKRLLKILDDFPGLDDINEFYFKLMNLTLDYPNYKKSLGGMNWAANKMRDFHKKYISMIYKEKDRNKIKGLSKEFYGRVSSLFKQIDPNFKILENSRRIMKTYPDVKEMFTVCIYGFPNVGKSTLLNKLTKTHAEVAAYAFTTKSINCGFMTVNGEKVQVLDVPGTLARKEKMNNIELQADLVLKEVADAVIYVFDLSENCGYSMRHQESLYKSLNDKKRILIYLSKTDVMDPELVKEFKHKHYSIKDLKEKIGKLAKN